MSGLHPIADREVFKEEIRDRKVRYTHHFEVDRLPYRKNIDKDLIEKHLQTPVDLLNFAYEEDSHDREKYEVLFDKSTKYYLKVVLSMQDDSLYIVTAHVVNKTKKEKSKIIGG